LGDLRFESAMTFANNIQLVNSSNPDPIHTNGNTVNLSGIISSTGDENLVKIGAGTLILSGANTYTVGTTISGGTLQVGNGGTTGSLGSTSGVTNNAELAVNRSNAITISPTISGTGALTQAGTGTTTVSANNTFSGGVSITNGTLAVSTVAPTGTAQPLGQASTAITLGGASTTGTFEYTGATATLNRPFTVSASAGSAGVIRNSGAGTLTLSNTLTKDGKVLTLTGGSFNVTGTITGASANSDLVVDAAAVTLSNANTYDGPTYLRNAATLNANVANALPTSPARSDIIMDDTGSGSSTLALAASQSIASLSGASSSTVNLGGNTLTIGKTSGSTVFGGTITGSGSVQKDGGSTLTLNSANTHSGGVTVTEGTLAVKNTTGSATGSGDVTATGGTILGTGRVSPASGGSVIFGNASILSVGDAGDTSGKTLIFTPVSGTMSTTFQSGSVVEFDLFTGAGSGDNSGIGTSADALQWGGTLALLNNVKLRVNNPNTMTAFAEGDIWKVLDWTTFGGSAPSGTFEASLLELPTLTGLLGWDTSNLYTAGTLGIIVVPEPSRAVLMFGGLLAIVIRRRR
jgi:autotransporter-associated beta strand protein